MLRTKFARARTDLFTHIAHTDGIERCFDEDEGMELVRAAAKEGVDVAVAVEGILRDDENEDRDRAAINASYQLLQDHVTKVGTEDADTFALALLARAYCNTCPHCSPFPGDPRRGRRYLNIGA